MSSIRLKYQHEAVRSEQKSHLNKAQLVSTSLILNFLNDKELLNYRLICYTTYEASQKILGLYENPIQFILGTSQYFSSKEELKKSWLVYKKSVDNEKKSSLKPALLYKSNDPSPAIFIHTEFPEGEKVLENGRIYQCIPAESYTWPHNAAWLLGLIHLGRPCLLTSPLIRKFIFRQDGPHGYSAWTKEIVALSKAGYRVTNINSRGYITLSLGFQHNDEHKRCNIKNLNADDKEIEKILNETLGDVYQKSWILISNREPTHKDFKQYDLILRKAEKQLTAFWIKNGKITNESLPNSSVQDILKVLPRVNDSTDNEILIEHVKSKYSCTLIKTDKQQFIRKQLTSSSNKCLIM